MARTTKADNQLSFGLIITDPEAHRIQAMRQPRKCLSCSKTFNSTGPGHRICSPCKDLDVWTSPNEFSVAVSF
jgi:hypothetical protein